MTTKSINQLAQEDGDSSANEAARIRERQATVAKAWRRIAYDEGESACTADRIATETSLPADFIRFVCVNTGLTLQEPK